MYGNAQRSTSNVQRRKRKNTGRNRETFNAQLPTLNFQRSTKEKKRYRKKQGNVQRSILENLVSQQSFNLEDRLLNYAAALIQLIERLPHTRSGNHIAGQILRSGTSPLPNHGEAQAAESKNDFVHKMSHMPQGITRNQAVAKVNHTGLCEQTCLPNRTFIKRNRRTYHDFFGEHQNRPQKHRWTLKVSL